jgi:cobyrinic acid a,c-diamide synthase
VRIAVARDGAFHFYYQHNLDLLREAGAELIDFSPCRDALPPDVHGLLLGGGYPEVFAAELSQNQRLKEQITLHHACGKPIYAECGGLIYLTRELVTLDGKAHPMVGLIAARVTMNKKLAALGYVEVTTRVDTPLGMKGIRFRGHQFRYSSLELLADSHDELLFDLKRPRKEQLRAEGYGRGNLVASYVHAHWASAPLLAANFVAACRKAAHPT